MSVKGAQVGGDLRFEVLGPVRAWRGAQEVELGSPQQRAILAIMLLRDGGTVTPDELIRAIWGESAPRAAIGMIRSYVSRLRRVLDSDSIDSVAGGYAMPGGSVDIAEFQRLVAAARSAGRVADKAAALRSALELWKGIPLAGVRGEYANFERLRLSQLRLAVLEDLAAADIELGRHVQAIADLTALVSEEPFRERPRELLMLALYRSGRQAEALRVFHEAQQVLADELGIDPGPDLRAMHERILGSDPGLAAAPSGVSPVPAQLPPELPDFVGRDSALLEILDGVGSSGVVGIVGLAGLGKTALAVRAGLAVASSFPDGQFFVDLSVTPDPLPGLLRGLGMAVPSVPAEQVAAWRTYTSGRKVLVVIDGAREAAQVTSLLPASGGAAVITSRQRLFGVPSVRWVKLEPLRPAEAYSLLSRIVGSVRLQAEPESADRLVAATDGLPQIIRALGSRLAARPNWTLAAAEKRIRKPDWQHPQPVECVELERPYESALADLPPAQARAFRLVSLADSPDITIHAAAALLDTDPDTAETLLEALLDQHLIEPAGPDRYRYRPPLKTFARTHATTDEGEHECHAALARLVHSYTTPTPRFTPTPARHPHPGCRITWAGGTSTIDTGQRASGTILRAGRASPIPRGRVDPGRRRPASDSGSRRRSSRFRRPEAAQTIHGPQAPATRSGPGGRPSLAWRHPSVPASKITIPGPEAAHLTGGRGSARNSGRIAVGHALRTAGIGRP